MINPLILPAIALVIGATAGGASMRWVMLGRVEAAQAAEQLRIGERDAATRQLGVERASLARCERRMSAADAANAARDAASQAVQQRERTRQQEIDDADDPLGRAWGAPPPAAPHRLRDGDGVR